MHEYHHIEQTFEFPDAYRAVGWGSGVAWHVWGNPAYATDDTEWSGIYRVDTDVVVAVMVGDDQEFLFEAGELEAIEPDTYCGECGQIGCGCG